MFDFDFSDPDEPPRPEGYDRAEDVSDDQPLYGFEDVPSAPGDVESDANNRLEDNSDDEPLIGFEEVPHRPAAVESEVNRPDWGNPADKKEVHMEKKSKDLEDVHANLHTLNDQPKDAHDNESLDGFKLAPPGCAVEDGQHSSSPHGKKDAPKAKIDKESEGVCAKVKTGNEFEEHSVPAPTVRIPLLLDDDQVTVDQETWANSAKMFGEMILSLQRVNCKAGRGWFHGMRKLLTCGSKNDWGFGDFAGRLSRNNYLAWTSPHPWAVSFRKLYLRLEVKVAEATGSVDPACDWTSDTDMYDDKYKQLLQQEGLPLGPFAGYGGRHLLFVGLPLCMYVSDCSHLYILVRRLRTLRVLAAKGLLTAKSMLAILNADDKPYAILTFAIIAALQVLHSSRVPGKSKKGAAGLEALCASAQPCVRTKFGANSGVSVASDHFDNAQTTPVEYAPGGRALLRQDGHVSGGKALIFRGIWVPQSIDEDAVACTWSLNSFSRSLEGALWVLDYYATDASDMATRKLAQRCAHAFIYVGRFYTDPPELVFPIQFFSSGVASDIEKEVLVPPFVNYVFEKGSDKGGEWDSISNRHPPQLRTARLEEVERRWGMRFGSECPLLLKFLFGANLVNQHVPGVRKDLDVTIRFIRSIEPAEPIKEIFGAPNQPPENLLLKFPADGNILDNRFGSGESALLDHYQNLIINGQHDKSQVAKDAKRLAEHWG